MPRACRAKRLQEDIHQVLKGCDLSRKAVKDKPFSETPSAGRAVLMKTSNYKDLEQL
jgi:hypothetical protein